MTQHRQTTFEHAALENDFRRICKEADSLADVLWAIRVRLSSLPSRTKGSVRRVLVAEAQAPQHAAMQTIAALL